MILYTQDSTLCWQITLTLLHVTWLGAFIGLMAAIAGRVFAQISAARRYWIHMTALMTLGASLPTTFVVIRALTNNTSPQAASPLVQTSNFNAPLMESSPPSYPPESSALATALDPNSEVVVADVRASANRSSSSISGSQHLRELAKSAAPLITVAYVIGVLLMLIKLGIGVRVTRRLRSSSVPISDVNLMARMAEQARKLSLRILPAIAICEHVAVPIVVGLLRPVILIPTAMISGLTHEQLEAVLTHEFAHLSRRDHILIVAQRLLEAILFFHPVTWYLSRHIHHEREYSCDDLVVSLGRDRVQYAQSLLRVAELRQSTGSGRRHLGLAADGQRPSKLRLRIMRLLDAREDDAVRINPRWLLATLTCIGIAGFWTSTIASQPLSKADEEAKSGSARLKTSDVVVLLEEQMDRIGRVVMQELRREEFDYLANAQRIQLVTESKQRLSPRVSQPISDAAIEEVLIAISRFFKERSEVWDSRQDTFMSHFALLEWRIWAGMDPLKLSDDDLNRREKQREWFRNLIRSRYDDNDDLKFNEEIDGELKAVTMSEFELLRYERLLSDPTYPFLFFLFTDEQFEQVKVSLQAKPVQGLAFMQIYTEHEEKHADVVKLRWNLPGDGGSATWGTDSELIQGFMDDSIADSTIPVGIEGELTTGSHDGLASSESHEHSSRDEKTTRYVPPKDALDKLLGGQLDVDAIRNNAAGMQYTSMTPASETDWEPVALEEAYETAMLAMEANYSKIKTWSGECEEVIFDRYNQAMTEKSLLVRFEWEVQASKGGAVQTTSVKPGLMKFEEEPIFREEAVFYTPFFFGRQNELHWERMEKYLQHFRWNVTPEARRFVLAYRAADHKSGLWKFEKAYSSIQDKLLVSQIISESHGYNVVRESTVKVLANGESFLRDDLLQSYSETDGVFVPAERLKREFEPGKETLRFVHLQKITRSIVNKPLQPLPVLVPEPPLPPIDFGTDDSDGFPGST